MPLRIRKIYNLIGFITILRVFLAISKVIVDISKPDENQEFQDKLVIVRFVVYFRRKFLGICKTIHFWNPWSMENPKTNVCICTDSWKAVILDIQNGRHRIHNLCYIGSYTTQKLNLTGQSQAYMAAWQVCSCRKKNLGDFAENSGNFAENSGIFVWPETGGSIYIENQR